MKSKPSLRSFLALSGSVFLVASQSHAITYYWDNNSTAAGLSTGAGTSGTWNGATNASNTYTNLVNFNNATLNSVTGTAGLVAGGTATTTADIIYFGTNNLSLGATASTIGTTGAININSILIGTGQTNNFTLGAGGTITLGGSTPAITVNSTSATATVAAPIAGSVGVTKAGPGTLILTDATNSFTGGLTIAGGGTLQVGDGISGSLTSQNLTFNSGGGTINFNEAAGSTQNMGTLNFSAGAGTVLSTYGGSGTSTLAFSTSTTRTAGATGNFVISGGSNGSTNLITLAGPASNAFIDKGLFFGGSKYAYYDAAGYVREMNYNAIDADTEVADTITAGRHVQLTASPLARPGDTLLSLNLAAGGVDYTMSSGSLTVPAILKSGGGAVSTISGGTSVTTDSNAELVIRTDAPADLLTINTAVTGFSGGLTKAGAGTLTLSNTNGYTGATNVNAGTLIVSGGDAIADGSVVNLANSSGTSFQLNGSETIGSLSGGGLSGGNVDVGANTLTLAGASTFGGKLLGSGGVTVSAGTFSLSNRNSFAGSITLNGTSQLALRYGSDSTTTTPTISSGGTINMSGGTFLLADPLAQLTAGVVRVPGGASSVGAFFSNPIVITSGTGTIRHGSALGARHVFNGGVTGGTSGSQILSIVQGFLGGNAERTTLTFSGIIQDGVGGTLGVSADFLAASGTGQGAFICLSGQNTFTGPIEVKNTRGLAYTPGVGNPYHGAWLVIGGEITSGFSDRTVTTGSGSLGTTTPGTGIYTNTISLATGTILNYASSANQILGGAISGTGNIVKEGAGTLSLTVANSYTGITTVSVGVLRITNATSLGTVAGGVRQAGTSELAIDGSGGDVIVGAEALTINGGGISNAGALRSIAGNNIWGGTVTLAAQSRINSDSGTLLLNNAAAVSATNFSLVVGGAGNTTISGAITLGNGGVSKDGAGTLTLSVPNSYNGATTVNAGTLLVNNTSGSGTGAGNVSVTAGTLGGTGSMTGNVTIGNNVGTADSILAPGSGIVPIATGNLSFNSDGSYACELDGTSATSDRVNVTGTVAINATATLAVSVTGSLSTGQKYFIVVNDDVDPVGGAGAFAGLAQDAIVGNYGGTDLKISYTGDLDTNAIAGGNDIVLYTAGLGTPYDSWATSKGLTGLPGSATDPAKDADPDQDGKSNLSEFAFDGEPLSGANDGKIVGKVATVGLDQVLTLTLPVRTGAAFANDGGDQRSALIDGIYYRIEGDVNLSTFADTITEVTGGDATTIQTGLPALSTGWTYRTFRAPGTVSTVPKAFLRAKVSETP